jgi:hypothetical protein
MTTSPLSENAVLNLFAPKVNGRTLPVSGADIGVPLVAYDLVTDGKGAYVVIDPPLSGTVDPNDVITLWLGSEPALLDSETIVDPNAITTLRIPKGRLHPDRINSIHYTVTRGSSNIGTSPSLEILYNRIRPGLKDRYDAPGGHSELKLLLPDAIRNGVGADFVSASVCASYPYCRAYDRISLKCNGELMTANVNPNQAPQPPSPGSEIPITICFTVDRAYLERAKRLDQKLHFSYTVTDQIGNGPDTDAPWSPVQTVDEDLDGTHLTMPILLERMQDYPGDDPGIIDLEKLGGNPLLLIIVAVDDRFEVGHDVVATYTATGTGQPADVVVTVSGKIEADAFGQKKPCILEIANNKVFPDSSVSVTYELFKPNGERVGKSIPAKGQVTGQAPIVLLPPLLLPPAVSPIDVLAYVNGLTLRIEYLLALAGDKAQLVEINPPAGSAPFPLVEFDGSKRVDTVLTAAFLAARHGKAIEFHWVLNRNSAPIAKSAELKTSVLLITDGDSRLPTPTVIQTVNQELDLNLFTGNADIRLAPWLGAQLEQTVWLKCVGTLESGADHNINLLTSHRLTAIEVINGLTNIILPRSQLNQLKTNSLFSVEASVAFNGEPDILKATLLPILKLNFKKINLVSGSENFEIVPLQIFRQNVPVKLNSGLTVCVLADSPGSIYNVQIMKTGGQPISFGSRTLLADRAATVRLKFNGLATKASADISLVHVTGSTIGYCDTDEKLLYRTTIPITSHTLVHASSYTAQPGEYIASIVIFAGPEIDGGIWIDNIKWFK